MSTTVKKTAAEMVTEAKSRVEHLTPGQVAAEVASGEAILIDIREPDERTANGATPCVHVTARFRNPPAGPRCCRRCP
jgi:hypothetical protein